MNNYRVYGLQHWGRDLDAETYMVEDIEADSPEAALQIALDGGKYYGMSIRIDGVEPIYVWTYEGSLSKGSFQEYALARKYSHYDGLAVENLRELVIVDGVPTLVDAEAESESHDYGNEFIGVELRHKGEFARYTLDGRA